MTGGSPASSAYAMPCGTSSADSTRPATTSLGNHSRRYDLTSAIPGTYARHRDGADIRLAGELGHDGSANHRGTL